MTDGMRTGGTLAPRLPHPKQPSAARLACAAARALAPGRVFDDVFHVLADLAQIVADGGALATWTRSPREEHQQDLPQARSDYLLWRPVKDNFPPRAHRRLRSAPDLRGREKNVIEYAARRERTRRGAGRPSG